MVVKLESMSLYADVYPSVQAKSRRDLEPVVTDCPRRQKRHTALPALVEDDSEDLFEPEIPKIRRSFLLPAEGLRRQKSISPQRREKLRRQLTLPSLSEDEEP